MRFLVRWAIRLSLLAVVLVVAVVLLKDALFKAFTERRLRVATGLDVRIGQVDLGLGRPRITLEDFKMYNPAEFGGSPLFDLAELHAECDVRALMSRKLHLKLLRLHLRELNIVESKEGHTNIVEFFDGFGTARNDSSLQTSGVSGFKFISIDVLNLSVEKVKFTSLRDQSRNAEFDMGIENEILTDVAEPDQIYRLLLQSVFRRGINITTGKGGTRFDLLSEIPPGEEGYESSVSRESQR